MKTKIGWLKVTKRGALIALSICCVAGLISCGGGSDGGSPAAGDLAGTTWVEDGNPSSTLTFGSDGTTFLAVDPSDGTDLAGTYTPTEPNTYTLSGSQDEGPLHIEMTGSATVSGENMIVKVTVYVDGNLDDTFTVSYTKQSGGGGDDNIDVIGTWQGNWQSLVYSVGDSFTANITQQDSTLSGSIDVPYLYMYDADLKGTVDGNTITFGDVADQITFTGTVSGNSASGTYVYPHLNDNGTWEATKSGGDGGNTGASDPAQIAEDYLAENNIDIASKKGVSYTGNYFPFVEGNTWEYAGSGIVTASSNTSVAIPGNAPQQNSTGPTSSTVPLISKLKVLPAEQIRLSDGVYSLYPIEEYTQNYLLESGSSLPTVEVNRYFEKKDGNVYIRAIKTDSGTILTVEDPVYLKSTLVVGDAWSSEPSIDIDEYLDESNLDSIDTEALAQFNMDLSINFDDPVISSIFVVIGEESVRINNATVDAVRVDQVVSAEIIGYGSTNGVVEGVNVNATFDVSMSLNAAIQLFFQEDVGIVKDDEKMSFDIDMNIVISAQGESATMNFEIMADGDASISLTSSEITLDDTNVNEDDTTETVTSVAEDTDALESLSAADQMNIVRETSGSTTYDGKFNSKACMEQIAQQIEAQTISITKQMIKNVHLK